MMELPRRHSTPPGGGAGSPAELDIAAAEDREAVCVVLGFLRPAGSAAAERRRSVWVPGGSESSGRDMARIASSRWARTLRAVASSDRRRMSSISAGDRDGAGCAGVASVASRAGASADASLGAAPPATARRRRSRPRSRSKEVAAALCWSARSCCNFSPSSIRFATTSISSSRSPVFERSASRTDSRGGDGSRSLPVELRSRGGGRPCACVATAEALADADWIVGAGCWRCCSALSSYLHPFFWAPYNSNFTPDRPPSLSPPSDRIETGLAPPVFFQVLTAPPRSIR